MTRRSPSYTRRSSVGALLPAIASTTARRVREDASRGFRCPAVKSPQPLSLPAETPDISSRDKLPRCTLSKCLCPAMTFGGGLLHSSG